MSGQVDPGEGLDLRTLLEHLSAVRQDDGNKDCSNDVMKP